MRFFKVVAPALTAVGLLLGASANAADLAKLDSFTASGVFPQPLITLRASASGAAVGQACFFKANGMTLVGATILLPGQNTVVVPDLGPWVTYYTASGPGLETISANATPELPGIN